ncbi:patatin-like phospholipase family protein [Aquincola sp. S2]|uniref:Patatin-like phospholipase family protein n=1 Tax=Pseudaquabacterium terrae TaxID=2732868 RepID=A0ABX2EQM4_9BURK|nr:patatin-like phospholipase family protein [Aquabacterium terrae]NRF70923.1 patatin-like phospholipase family protein [Aquabacterium terrae]
MRWLPALLRRPPSLALALQGGGAHGAFTWGVLDALLERFDEHPIEAISGTSAGAMNAVVLAHGLLDGGAEGARAALARFWHAVGTQLPFEWLTQGGGSETALTPAARWWLQWSRLRSPYQRLTIEPDPLRSLLDAQVDFERLRRSPGPQLHIAATHAQSGRLRLFRRSELTIDGVLASACLPMLQQAVMIDGEPYWDGGYSANPAIFPLLGDGAASDLLIVMLSPWQLGPLPTTPAEIQQRAMDIGFNATFLREMQAITRARAAARRHWWRSRTESRLARLRWHLIDGHETLAPLSPDSRLIAHRPFLEHLRDAGRARALAWLLQHGPSVGRHSSADLGALFGHHAPTPPRAMPAA